MPPTLKIFSKHFICYPYHLQSLFQYFEATALLYLGLSHLNCCSKYCSHTSVTAVTSLSSFPLTVAHAFRARIYQRSSHKTVTSVCNTARFSFILSLVISFGNEMLVPLLDSGELICAPTTDTTVNFGNESH